MQRTVWSMRVIHFSCFALGPSQALAGCEVWRGEKHEGKHTREEDSEESEPETCSSMDRMNQAGLVGQDGSRRRGGDSGASHLLMDLRSGKQARRDERAALFQKTDRALENAGWPRDSRHTKCERRADKSGHASQRTPLAPLVDSLGIPKSPH